MNFLKYQKKPHIYLRVLFVKDFKISTVLQNMHAFKYFFFSLNVFGIKIHQRSETLKIKDVVNNLVSFSRIKKNDKYA